MEQDSTALILQKKRPVSTKVGTGRYIKHFILLGAERRVI
jgi:hypothetical protein